MQNARNITTGCRFTTYRHRFARVAPAPRAKLIDSSKAQRFEESWTRVARQHHRVHLFFVVSCVTSSDLDAKRFKITGGCARRTSLTLRPKTPREPRCARQAMQCLWSAGNGPSHCPSRNYFQRPFLRFCRTMLLSKNLTALDLAKSLASARSHVTLLFCPSLQNHNQKP